MLTATTRREYATILKLSFTVGMSDLGVHDLFVHTLPSSTLKYKCNGIVGKPLR